MTFSFVLGAAQADETSLNAESNIAAAIAAGESLTGYGYFLDFADLGTSAAAGLGESGNPSNKTLGLRLDGAHPLVNFKLLYTNEYAKQTALANGDARINAY